MLLAFRSSSSRSGNCMYRVFRKRLQAAWPRAWDRNDFPLCKALHNGKSFISEALGVAACRNFYKVRYIRLPELLNEIAVARGMGVLEDALKQ
ncbi:hypothetical protein EOM86_13655 [Candidatus Nomurabacteria bacterium]|nr:hypothetical protein [Candidatus Nomurabacteria bacterium]